MFISRSPVKPKVPIGLVRTDQGWTLAQVARDGQGVLHPLVCRASAELPPEVVATGAGLVMALPDALFHHETLSLPRTVAAQDIEFQLGLQLAERLPWPLAECAWDWRYHSEHAEEGVWSCCVVPQVEVNRWQDWAQGTGCTLLALEPAQQALDREARWPWQGLPQEDTSAARLAWGLSLRLADEQAGFNLLPHRALRSAQARQQARRKLGIVGAALALCLTAAEGALQAFESQTSAEVAALWQAQRAEQQALLARREQLRQWSVLQAQAASRQLQQRQHSASWESVLASVPEPEAGMQWQSVQWQPERLTWVGLAANERLFNQWRGSLGGVSVVQRWEQVRWSAPGQPVSHPAWQFEVRWWPAEN